MENSSEKSSRLEHLVRQTYADVGDVLWQMSNLQQTLRELRWSLEVMRARESAQLVDLEAEWRRNPPSTDMG